MIIQKTKVPNDMGNNIISFVRCKNTSNLQWGAQTLQLRLVRVSSQTTGWSRKYDFFVTPGTNHRVPYFCSMISWKNCLRQPCSNRRWQFPMTWEYHNFFGAVQTYKQSAMRGWVTSWSPEYQFFAILSGTDHRRTYFILFQWVFAKTLPMQPWSYWDLQSQWHGNIITSLVRYKPARKL